MSLIGCPYKQTLSANLLYILFIFTNVALFLHYCERKNSKCLKEFVIHANKYPTTPFIEQWGRTQYFKILRENFEQKSAEWRLSTKFIDVHTASTMLNCSSISKIESLQYVAAGWTKTTYKAQYNNLTLSMKVVNVAGHDVSTCLLQNDKNLYDCFLMAAFKLLHEIIILHSISHPNIVKVLGYCVPNELDVENPLHAVAIFEEYGEPISVIKMLQMSWEDRLRKKVMQQYQWQIFFTIVKPTNSCFGFAFYLKCFCVNLRLAGDKTISLGLSRLLKHLSSFQVPVALNDLRRQQFIIVDGEPKLVDVDDVGLEEPSCLRAPCRLNTSSSVNRPVSVPCVDWSCHGYNEKLNILKIGSHFINHILPYGAPSSLEPIAWRISSAYERGSWNSDDILKEIENLTHIYKSGGYRKSTSKFLSAFKEFNHRDISNHFDYRCQLTASGYGCIVSVIDAEEAAEICLSEYLCKGFVFTNVFTWTGRRMVHLKNGVGNLIINNATTVYVKR